MNKARQVLCFHEDLYLRGGGSVQLGKYTNKVIANALKTNQSWHYGNDSEGRVVWSE